jgi:hypothetical protein
VGEKINLTTKKRPSNNAIPRGKDSVKFTEYPGLLVFDIDGGVNDGFTAYSTLLEIIPELQGVACLIRPSSSSFINATDGSELTDGRGWHIFFAIKKTSDSERIKPILWARMWLKGYGKYCLNNPTKAEPSLLNRGFYDNSVTGESERILFEAKPILKNGLTRNAETHTRIINGGLFDSSVIAELSPDDLAKVEELKQHAKEAIEPERRAKRKATRTQCVIDGVTAGKTVKEALRDYRAASKHDLPSDFVLFTEKGERTAGSLTAKDDGIALADPLEPDTNNLTKAKFYLNNGKPIINSFLHGGAVYKIPCLNARTHAPDVGNASEPPDPAPDFKADLLANCEKLNRFHAQVLLGNKHFIMREVPAKHSHTGRDTLEFYKQADFDRIYQNDLIQVGWNKYGKPILKTVIDAWTKHPKCRVYKGGVVFKPIPFNAPETTNPAYYNTWRGYAVRAKPARDNMQLERIYYHIEKIMCKGIPELYTYFYNWIAYTFQHPDKPAGAAVVFPGEKGTGKGLMGHFLKAMWGNHGVHIINAKHLIGAFNGHLDSCCFLFCDEAFYSNDKQHEGVLKGLITEPVLMVEHKGIDAIQQTNFLKFYMATNSEWAVPATKDERRFFVSKVSNERRGDREYFNALWSDVHDPDCQAAFLYEMLHRDITGFHTGDIPESEGLKEQRLHSLDSVGKWFMDCLSGGQFEINRDKEGYTITEDWKPYIKANALFLSYLYWCDNQRISEYNRVTQTRLGKVLTEWGFKAYRSNGISRKMLDLDAAIIQFEQKTGATIPTIPQQFQVVSHE